MTGVLGRYDVRDLLDRLAAAGVFAALREKGFADFDVRIDAAGRALPHIRLYGRKGGRRPLLLEACVGEAVIRPQYFVRHGWDGINRPLELAVVHWVREQDPTVEFPPNRPRLPLQRHPGLGVLRRAFQVIVEMAREVGKDGVASVPKFFHDAVIFYRSRLFLFLDGSEQGRFEALMRDLRSLGLGDASLALVGGCVTDAEGAAAAWSPGYQVFPISPRAAAYFHSANYSARVDEALAACRFCYDLDGLVRARRAARLA